MFLKEMKFVLNIDREHCGKKLVISILFFFHHVSICSCFFFFFFLGGGGESETQDCVLKGSDKRITLDRPSKHACTRRIQLGKLLNNVFLFLI